VRNSAANALLLAVHAPNKAYRFMEMRVVDVGYKIYSVIS